MNLFTVAEWLAAFSQPDVAFHPDRCQHRGDRLLSCRACYEACPSGAIIEGKTPTFNSEKCIGCHACVPACPCGAFQSGDLFADLLLASPVEAGGELDLYCARNARNKVGPTAESMGYPVKGCLAGLGAGAYLTLTTLGYERVWVRTDACADCPIHRLEPYIVQQVERARRLLSLWGKADALEITASMDKPVQRPVFSAGSTSTEISRRDLFRMAARRHAQPARPAPVTFRPIAHADKLSRDRVQMLQAARAFTQALCDPNAPLQEPGFARLAISKDCTACGACARACTTGALSFDTDKAETSFQLAFQSDACTGCENCLKVCSAAAISIDHAPSAGEIFLPHAAVVLQSGVLRHCERCQTRFAVRDGHNHLCGLCEYRAVHPFGSRLPPGFSRLNAKVEEKNPA